MCILGASVPFQLRLVKSGDVHAAVVLLLQLALFFAFAMQHGG